MVIRFLRKLLGNLSEVSTSKLLHLLRIGTRFYTRNIMNFLINRNQAMERFQCILIFNLMILGLFVYNFQVTERTVHRAEDYKLPAHLEKHVFAVFNTVQAPPPLNQRYHVHPREENISPSRNAHLRGDDGNDTASVANDQSTNPVTVAFLNKLYKIPSNKGSSNQYQSVFQTSNEYYFPGDLTSFQQAYGLHVQAATAANGNVATTASVVSSSYIKLNNCNPSSALC